MALERRIGGLPLAVYVAALLLIPLVGVGFFGTREIDRNNRAAVAAESIATAADVYVSAASLLAPLEVDRMASLGLVRIDELGLDRATFVPLMGIDYESIAATNGRRLSSSFDALDAALDSRPVGALRASAADQRAALDTVRSSVAAGTGSFADVDAAFDAAFALVDDVLESARAELTAVQTDAADAADLVRRLDLVVQVVTTARAEAETFSAIAFGDGTASSVEMMTDGVRHADALAAAEPVDPSGVTDLSDAYVALPAMPEWMFSDDAGGIDEEPAAGDVQSVSAAVLAHLEYLGLVSDFATESGMAVGDSVAAWAGEAGDRNRTTLTLFALIGIATLVFGTVVIRSFAQPLKKLRAQAERISRGELTSEPLDLAGPSDVRKVTGAINEMASTLSLVEVHMDALAVTENGVGPELQQLPGHVGASMRTSMERVTALTTRLQMSEARLAEEARIDNLTGLPNRFAVLEFLEDLAREPVTAGGTAGVMFVDVDGFKSVNDTHGHAVGDVVLREIAQRLSGSVRDVDFVARLGGDEFLIVVGDVSDPDRLLAFGERVIEEIEQPYIVGEQLFGVSASVGATIMEPGDHSMSAVERADAAVYQAKRRGRRRVEMFDKELQASIEHQAELELALRQAIHHDELRIYLQPLADMATGCAAGAEALVRWERPGVGLVPPGDFIPIAERSGLIFEVERWVLDAACRRVAEWRLAGRGDGMRLAVNISGRHLIEGNLVADLDAAIAATGADPNLLEIELTESHLLDDVGRASAVLASVRDRGVKVAIDDFGTGYSSMTYLQKLPVDVVKIDRSFIATATANEFDSTIVESVVTIGRALSLDVVAEGIETFDQLAYAMSAGVTLGQGFLFARPMPAGEAEAVMFGPALFDADRVRREAGLEPLPWTAVPPSGAPVELVD